MQTLPFADGVKMMSPCSQSGSKQCLEVVLKLRSPNLLLSSGISSLCHGISWRFHTGHNLCYRLGRSHGWFLLTSHALQRGCLQSKTCAVFDKAVFIIPQITDWFGLILSIADTDYLIVHDETSKGLSSPAVLIKTTAAGSALL